MNNNSNDNGLPNNKRETGARTADEEQQLQLSESHLNYWIVRSLVVGVIIAFGMLFLFLFPFCSDASVSWGMSPPGAAGNWSG